MYRYRFNVSQIRESGNRELPNSHQKGKLGSVGGVARVGCGTELVSFAVTVVSNTQFFMDFAGILNAMVAFVQVPFQDTQVQNLEGGFVRPGGQWFRTPSGG